jgi:Carboxypeptidase regulatory-like domain
MNVKTAGISVSISLLLFAQLSFGQTESATFSGNVLDGSGGRVANATVDLESLETGAKRGAMSGSSGVFSMTALPVGHYKVTIQAPGFESYVLDNVQLQTGQHLTLDVRLQVGVSSAEVDVVDTATRLDESTATVGGVVSGEQVRELPINGRSWASLMTQTPGAIDGGTDNQRSIRFIGRGLDDNNYRLDGVDATGGINQAEKGTFRLQFSTEAIAEF